ncbi:MAG: hypothetical protein CMM60_05130 [Rhodospirillaceae bacterium]|jgi:hypothetical protein|nr:hypothetical protein [Rhodospirillaceae bacterium]|tara:strand:- start:4184 stop:4972 length:789 start_codon:yes stop_codon:yes gene_type:complete
MCTVVILRRPGYDWPLILAANRDEMADRPWRAPGRHWSERAEVTAGRDELAGGTWLGLNDWGVISGVLNRPESLGPDPELRSRGELPLDALDHAEAAIAAEAMAAIDPQSYRSFNLVITDAREAFWLCSKGGGEAVRMAPVPEGLSMLTAHDLNDTTSARIRHFLPLFEAAPAPDPETGEWYHWQALMGSRGKERTGEKETGPESGPEGAMTLAAKTGFGTVSSSLLALPGPARTNGPGAIKPVWLFAPGPPDETPYGAVDL